MASNKGHTGKRSGEEVAGYTGRECLPKLLRGRARVHREDELHGEGAAKTMTQRPK